MYGEPTRENPDMDDPALAQAVGLSLFTLVCFRVSYPFAIAAFSTSRATESGQHMLYERHSPGHACHPGAASRSPKVRSSLSCRIH